MSPTLNAHGVSVSPPPGFEGRVFRRPAFGEVTASAADGPPAPPGEVPNVVVQVSTIALPPDTGDFASGAVDRLDHDDVLIVLFEYDASAAAQGLFSRQGVPRVLGPDDFSPTVLQRTIQGQAGCQFFFSEGGRAFCLYVVLGAHARRAALVAKVNAVLATLRIEPLGAKSATSTTTMPPPASTSTMPPLPPTTTTTTTPPRPTSTTTP